MAETNPILNQAASTNAVATPVAPAPVVSDKLAAVEQALATSTSRIVEGINTLEQAGRDTKTQTNVAVSAIESANSAKQIINTSAQNANLQAQNSTIDAFEAMGGQEAQIALAKELAVDQKRVGDLMDQKLDIVAREHTGIQIIDNIVNSFASSQLDQTINAAANKQAQTQKEIAGISASTESIARNNALTKRTLNEGTLKANYDAIAAEGNLQAAQQELQNISANSDNMVRLVGMDAKSVTNLMSVWRTENEAAQVELSQERMVLAREQMAIDREKMVLEIPAAKVALERSELALDQAKTLGPTQIAQAELNLAKTTKAQKDLVATQARLVESVQRGQKLTGLQVEDTETILFSLSKGGESGEKYIRLQELGGVADLKLGSTPFEAVDNLRTVAPEGTSIDSKATDFLAGVADALAASGATVALAGESDKETKARLKSKFNQVAETTAAIHKSDITFGDSTNLYQAPPMGALDNFQSVQTSFFYQKIIKPMDMKEVHPQKILDAATTAILAKSVTVEEAATGIEAMFEAAASYNNTQDGGPSRVGLPNQDSYNTKILTEGQGAFSTISNILSSGITGLATGKGPSLVDKTSIFKKKPQVSDLMNLTDIKMILVKMIGGTPEEVKNPNTPATDK